MAREWSIKNSNIPPVPTEDKLEEKAEETKKMQENPAAEKPPKAENVKNVERKSGITRIVNAGDKEQDILNEVEDIFNDQTISEYDREKTEEEITIIKEISQKVFNFVGNFGGVPVMVKPENIHLLNISKLTEEMGKEVIKKSHGYYMPELQGVVIFDELKKDRGSFIKTLIHELLHFNSFQSLKFINNKAEINRIGFGVFSYKNNKIFFNNIEEAIISELTVRICSNFLAKDELNKILMDYQYRLTPPWITMDNIYQKNKDKFNNKEDVFTEFAKVSFVGGLKNIAKLIENTFGKGSFRKLGERNAENIKNRIDEK